MLRENLFPKEVLPEVMVDALDDGIIVRVSESYARREGLPILRKWSPPQPAQKSLNKLGPKETGGMDTFRRPLRRDEGIRASLLDNFHWVLGQRRKQMHLSRKQLAEAVKASEYDIKLLENGVLPTNDFVLISALERHCGISLRKEPTASAPPTTSLRSARSVLAGGSMPRFGVSSDADSSSSKQKRANEQDLLESDDLLGDAVDLRDEE